MGASQLMALRGNHTISLSVVTATHTHMRTHIHTSSHSKRKNNYFGCIIIK